MNTSTPVEFPSIEPNHRQVGSSVPKPNNKACVYYTLGDHGYWSSDPRWMTGYIRGHHDTVVEQIDPDGSIMHECIKFVSKKKILATEQKVCQQDAPITG